MNSDEVRQMNDERCRCIASTAICGCISRGTGDLDFNGLWETPCPHGRAFEPYENDCSYHGTKASALELAKEKP